MSLNKTTFCHIFTWLLLLAVALCACKTKQVDLDKSKNKTEVKKQEDVTVKTDSTAVKKSTSVKTSDEKKDITTENTAKEKVIVFLPDKDVNGNQLIASITTRDIANKQTDKSIIAKTEIAVFLDSLQSIYQKIYELKLDSIGESQTKNKDVVTDSTVANNLPWWVWLVALIAFIAFLAYKLK